MLKNGRGSERSDRTRCHRLKKKQYIKIRLCFLKRLLLSLHNYIYFNVDYWMTKIICLSICPLDLCICISISPSFFRLRRLFLSCEHYYVRSHCLICNRSRYIRPIQNYRRLLYYSVSYPLMNIKLLARLLFPKNETACNDFPMIRLILFYYNHSKVIIYCFISTNYFIVYSKKK